jgi:hypothetical protein
MRERREIVGSVSRAGLRDSRYIPGYSRSALEIFYTSPQTRRKGVYNGVETAEKHLALLLLHQTLQRLSALSMSDPSHHPRYPESSVVL